MLKTQYLSLKIDRVFREYLQLFKTIHSIAYEKGVYTCSCNFKIFITTLGTDNAMCVR